MKNYKIKILLLLLVPAFFSCEEYLDKSPEMGITSEAVYSDYYNFKGAVDRAVGLMHNYVYDRFDYGKEIGTYSDESQQAQASFVTVTTINTGNWLDCNRPHFRWDMGNEEFRFRHSYREVPAEASYGIRAVNLCLENRHLLTDFPEESEYTEEELRNQLLGQCFFLRSWFYFMLIRDFGGLPNMQQSFATDADFDVERPEYWESAQWAIEDMDSAIYFLPETWDKTGTKDHGRVTKTTAKAVKQMMLLYAASPNYNIPRDQSLSFNGTPEYNLDIAADAMKANIEALESALSPSNR